MGLSVSEVMDYRRRDRLLGEMFTSLEEIVYPIFKPEEGCTPVLQIFDMYAVRKAGAGVEQWRLVLSDAEYYLEAVLAPELIENARREQFKKGSIVRIVEYEVYECSSYLKRIIKVIQLEVLVDFRIIALPMQLNLEEWREEDWEEEWTWLDPEEQEYEDEAILEEPCRFRDLAEAISPGAVAEINSNVNAALRPIILQIVDIRSIGNAQRERFRVVLSDGTHLQQAMLSSELNDKVKSNMAIKGSIVFLLKYVCDTVLNRRIVFVLEMEVLKVQADIVGNPIHFPSCWQPLCARGASTTGGGILPNPL